MQNGVVVQPPAETRIVSRSRPTIRNVPNAPSGPAHFGAESADLSWEKLAAEAQYRPMPLAVLCNVSLRTLQRHFQRQYGTTLSAWLNALRLTKAYDLIRGGESVKAAAFGLGFKQLSHFSRVFKEAHGVAPRLIAAQHPSPLARLFSTDLPGAELLPVVKEKGGHGAQALMAI